MTNRETRLKRFHYFLLLLTGFWGLALPGLVSLGWASGLAAVLWVFCFLCLTDEYRKPKQLLITGLVFLAGYLLHFASAVDIFWLFLGLFIPAGIALFGIFLLYSFLATRWKHWTVLFLFPVIWVSFYCIASLLNVPTLLRLDVLFCDQPVLMQAEQFLSSHGMTFVLALMLSLFHYAYKTKRIAFLLSGGAVYLFLIVFGIVTLFPNCTPDKSIRVAYTTGPYVGNYIDYGGLSYQDAVESMNRSADKAAEEGAKVLVFNEESFEIADADRDQFLSECCEAAKKNGIHMLVGTDIAYTNGQKNNNQISWISRDGEVLCSYSKTKLVPFFEDDYQPGNGVVPSVTLDFDGEKVTFSFLICYDSNYPSFVRKMNPDTDILLLPSWDWRSVTKLHAGLTRALVFENRISVLKPTYDGISIAIAPDGTVIHTSDTAETGYETVFTVDLPISQTQVIPQLEPYVHAILAVEIMSIIICLLLLIVHLLEDRDTSRRNRIFTLLVSTCIVALTTDALSWLLDECTRLQSVLDISTIFSLILPYVMAGQFVAYLTYYLCERKQISKRLLHLTMGYTLVACLFTVVACLLGKMYSYEQGYFVEGEWYTAYLVFNLLIMLYCYLIIFFFRKALNRREQIAAFMYPALPSIAALLNLFNPAFSYAFPSSTLSLIVIYIMIQSERVEKLTVNEQISSHNATHDELTGLLNRRAFDSRIQTLKDSEGSVGIMYADMNKLKYTNDNFGHAAGDRLLMNFSEMLSTFFRKDEIFRTGGDEFVVLMAGMREESFQYRVSKLLEVIVFEGIPMASIGVAFGESKQIDPLIKEAEEQMYRRKEAFHKDHPEFSGR